MKSLLDRLTEITPQRDVLDVAAECDAAFADRQITGLDAEMVEDPFHTALCRSREKRCVCLAVFGEYFCKITPDPTWMRALRLYQESKAQGIV